MRTRTLTHVLTCAHTHACTHVYPQAVADLAADLDPRDLNMLGVRLPDSTLSVAREWQEELDARERLIKARERWAEERERDCRQLPVSIQRHFGLASHMSFLVGKLRERCSQVGQRSEAAARHFGDACEQARLLAVGSEAGRERARRQFIHSMIEARNSMRTFNCEVLPLLEQAQRHIGSIQHDAELMGTFTYF